MRTVKKTYSTLFQAISVINKQLRQNCRLSSSLSPQIVPKSKVSTAESATSQPEPVVVTEKHDVKTTLKPLTDTFGRHHTYLRISLTERCNLRFFQITPSPLWKVDLTEAEYRTITLLSQVSSGRISQKRFCHLTHIDAEGKAKMVDVSDKDVSDRKATARAVVEVGPKITNLIHANNMSKGDVLSMSQIAGILGAKKTAELIPLCHNIFLSSVKVSAALSRSENSVIITATVRCSAKTGVEMEALTAVSIAALTVYDMCKAVSHDIVIKDIRLWEKSGGKRYFKREE